MKSASAAALIALMLGSGLAGGAAAATEACEGRVSATKLIVEVSGLREAKGEVAVTLYPDDAKRFLAPHKKMARVRATARAPTTTACFWLPAPGYYAVAIYHDENANRDFDRNFIGLPAEGFAFSNNPPTPVALPSFRSVRFKAGAGETRIQTRLRYLN
jgi:uncharacterized protein (DUF2141 family)